VILTNLAMNIRTAALDDIPEMFRIRLAVRENWISLDDLRKAGVTPESVRDVLETTGRGWVAEIDGAMVGYSIANAKTASVWAIFVLPGYEGRGLGRALLERAADWLWDQGLAEIWLRTGGDPETRANAFYRSQGWRMAGRMPDGDFRYVRSRPSSASNS
jgi:GNAT superfamily N-acetyltransferase